MSDKSKGFTIVELIVVVGVMGVLSGLVLVTLGDFYQANTTSLAQTTQDTDTRSTLRVIEEELASTTGFQQSLTVSAPLGQSNGNDWSYTGVNGNFTDRRVLIARASATTQATDESTRMPVILDSGSSCTAPDASSVAKNAYVYFLAPDSTNGLYKLYRRTIVSPEGTNYCGSNRPIQKTTCATGITHTACEGKDALLLSSVKEFKVDYYDAPDGTTPISYTAPAGQIASARAIGITVTTQKLIGGKQTDQTSTIRISRLF